MKEAIVSKASSNSLSVSIHDIAIPQPGPNQVQIKVVVSGSNPKDWKLPMLAPGQDKKNTGDDIAGYVSAIGPQVTEFKVGDRVAAFHEMRTPSGSFAEYAIAWEATTFHLPEKTSFEEGATVPLAAMTAAVGVYTVLGLPEPWNKSIEDREKCKGGVVVYGAASAVGAFVVKLLVKSDIHPIICVAGRGIDFVEGLIDKSKGDSIVDYRKGEQAIVQGLKAGVAKGETLKYAYDAVSEHGSYGHICQVLDHNGGRLTTVLPGKKYEGIPEGVKLAITSVGSVHQPSNRDFGYAWFRLFGFGLKEGWFTGHPYTVVKGGLGGVQEGLTALMEGKVSATKMVFRIEDTEGAEKSKI